MKTTTILFFILLFAFFIFHLNGEAQIIHIPADYPTIQQGIDAADNGDTVLVADGLYYENIDFLGKKPLMVASYFLLNGDTNHINNTIIDGSQPDDPNWGSVVIMMNGEDTTSVLCGFTVKGGTGTYITEIGGARLGGGVLITFGGKLLNNHIEYNVMTNNYWTAGGGVAVLGPTSPIPFGILRGNRIAHNKAISMNDEADGGGVANMYNLVLVDNEILANEASGPYRGDGGGVFIHGDFGHIELEIRNNKINYNKSISNSDITDIALSGGMDIFNDCSGIVSGNDISYNEIEVSIDAWGYGTGVLIQLKDIISPDFVFENNMISNNKFSGGFCVGGGLCIYESGGKYQNNVIRNNQGTHGGGIAIAYNSADNQAFLINNNMTKNSATYGGGLYMVYADAIVINSIIWGNEAQYSSSISYDQSILEVSYSDVEGDDYWPGEGNENVDPGFGDDGYHLSDSSPLWNEGIAATVINGITYECPEYDIDGEPRPWEFTDPEIGADETPSSFVSVEESAVVSRQSSVETYPNPTSGIVDFRLSMVDFRWVSLKVYNAHGQEVATVLDGEWSGDHVVGWDASNLPAGVYYYRLTTKDQRPTTGKIVKY